MFQTFVDKTAIFHTQLHVFAITSLGLIATIGTCYLTKQKLTTYKVARIILYSIWRNKVLW